MEPVLVKSFLLPVWESVTVKKWIQNNNKKAHGLLYFIHVKSFTWAVGGPLLKMDSS